MPVAAGVALDSSPTVAAASREDVVVAVEVPELSTTPAAMAPAVTSVDCVAVDFTSTLPPALSEAPLSTVALVLPETVASALETPTAAAAPEMAEKTELAVLLDVAPIFRSWAAV